MELVTSKLRQTCVEDIYIYTHIKWIQWIINIPLLHQVLNKSVSALQSSSDVEAEKMRSLSIYYTRLHSARNTMSNSIQKDENKQEETYSTTDRNSNDLFLFIRYALLFLMGILLFLLWIRIHLLLWSSISCSFILFSILLHGFRKQLSQLSKTKK